MQYLIFFFCVTLFVQEFNGGMYRHVTFDVFRFQDYQADTRSCPACSQHSHSPHVALRAPD